MRTPRCHATGEAAALRQFDLPSDDQTTGPGRSVSCLFLHEYHQIARSSRRFRQTARSALPCTIAGMTTPSRQARLHTRRVQATQRAAARERRRTDAFGEATRGPRRGHDPRHAQPARACDDSPIGSRPTRPTTGRSSSGCRARGPFGSRNDDEAAYCHHGAQRCASRRKAPRWSCLAVKCSNTIPRICSSSPSICRSRAR